MRGSVGFSVWGAAAGIALAVACIFFFYPLGVGADYVNHLARAHILSTIDASAALQRVYEIDYSFVPNYSMEMLVPRLEPVFGIYSAGVIVAAAAAVFAPLSGVALSRALNGSAGAWLPLLGFAAVFNRNLEFGFINFLFGLGLALAVFALWVRIGPGWRRAAWAAPLAALVAANHILAFLFLGYIALVWECAHYAYGKRGDRRAFGFSLLIRDGLAFLPGLALITYGFLIADDVSTYRGDVAMMGQRIAALTAGFGYFNSTLSVIAGTVALAAFAGGLYVGLRSGALSIHREMAWVCAAVFVLILIMPTHLAGIWGLHLRYGGALLILTAASLTINKPSAVNAAGFAALGVVALLYANGVAHTTRINAAFQEMRAAAAMLSEDARVLPATAPDVGFDIGVHAVSLAVIEADAYAPNLFTNISAVGVAAPLRAIHMPQGKPLLPATLDAVRATPLPPASNGRWSETFYYGWPDHFTHILYTRTPGAAGIGLDGVCLLAEGAIFALYRVGDCAGPGAG